MEHSSETHEQMTFRIHMRAETVDITASSPEEARKKAKKVNPCAVITKVKVLRDEVDDA